MQRAARYTAPRSPQPTAQTAYEEQYDAAVSPPRLIQLAGILIVTFVMIRSYVVSDMAFQFGGLGVGAAIFLLGRMLEKRAPR